MHSTPFLHRLALALGIALLTTQPVLANCSAAMESCSSSCNSSMTSGFIVGMAGALGRNSAAYQQGQNQLQQAQACASRCSAQHDACNQMEQAQQAQQQQAEAQQRAEQQRAQAQRQAQERAQAERQALQQRVNRVISPPVQPALAIKDATPLLLQAQEHAKDSNPGAAAYIYKMVLQGSTQPKQRQAARVALRQQALDEFTDVGTHQPGAYARLLAEYEPLGVFASVEQAQLAAMAPDSTQGEDAARDYLRKNPKGTLRDLAEAVIQAAPQLRAKEAEEKKRMVDAKARAARIKAQAEENDRLLTAQVEADNARFKNSPFEPVSDVDSVTQQGVGNLLVVNRSLPVKTLAEFVDYVKARPNQLIYCSSGVGGASHTTMESLASYAGLQMVHVPYKGMTLCMQFLLEDRVLATFADMTSSWDLIRSGRVRVLAKAK